MIFGLPALERRRDALAQRSAELRAALVAATTPFGDKLAVAERLLGLVRVAPVWIGRALLVYSFLKRR